MRVTTQAIAASTADTSVVEVEALGVSFRREGRTITPVRDVSFGLARARTLCIIGESGSGKTLTLKALIGLLPVGAVVRGAIHFHGRDVTALPYEEMRRIRGARMGMVFQEPATALDPVYTIGRQICETIMAHDGIDVSAARARALELLELVSIPNAEQRFRAYPHELSGGMRQRAMIAIALACRPDVLLADEPTTALDVTVQMQVLFLLRGLQQRLGMAVIFVTHDVAVAAEIADEVAVMYAGSIVETGSAERVLVRPQHPYTQGLLASRASGASRGADIPIIPGGPPNPAEATSGCSFHPRCQFADEMCRKTEPESRQLGDGWEVKCWQPGIGVSPKIVGGP